MVEFNEVKATDIVNINPIYHFRWEEKQDSHLLLYPEGVVKLNKTGAAILERCDGKHTVTQIISELNDIYSTDVTKSIYKFLEVSYAKGWIKLNS